MDRARDDGGDDYGGRDDGDAQTRGNAPHDAERQADQEEMEQDPAPAENEPPTTSEDMPACDVLMRTHAALRHHDLRPSSKSVVSVAQESKRTRVKIRAFPPDKRFRQQYDCAHDDCDRRAHVVRDRGSKKVTIKWVGVGTCRPPGALPAQRPLHPRPRGHPVDITPRVSFTRSRGLESPFDSFSDPPRMRSKRSSKNFDDAPTPYADKPVTKRLDALKKVRPNSGEFRQASSTIDRGAQSPVVARPLAGSMSPRPLKRISEVLPAIFGVRKKLRQSSSAQGTNRFHNDKGLLLRIRSTFTRNEGDREGGDAADEGDGGLHFDFEGRDMSAQPPTQSCDASSRALVLFGGHHGCTTTHASTVASSNVTVFNMREANTATTTHVEAVNSVTSQATTTSTVPDTTLRGVDPHL